jgi:ADP-heptose:LPS heptosyltransferase
MLSWRQQLRRLDQFRREHTQGFSNNLFRVLGKSRHLLARQLTPAEVKRILVVRNNKRIGNMYFMLPFMRELKRAYPEAKIDLMLLTTEQGRVFDNISLNQIVVSHFSFDTTLKFLKTIITLRRTVYDLLIMPHSSSSDALMCAFLNARNKVSFYGPRNRYIFPQSFDIRQHNPHAALSALALLEALGHEAKGHDHTMIFSDAEDAGGKAVALGLKAQAQICIAYFRGARGNKVIDDATWLRIRQDFDKAKPQSIKWVEILSPDIRSALIPDTSTFESADLRHLAAMLKHIDLFMCADTGPLHLADAAGAACIGLFTNTNIEHYGCLNDRSVNVTDIKSFDVNATLARYLS